MELHTGDVVRSSAGHDKGRLYIVAEVCGEGVRVVDGRLRRLVKPKYKNIRHIRFAARPDSPVELEDSAVRRTLALCRENTEQ